MSGSLHTWRILCPDDCLLMMFPNTPPLYVVDDAKLVKGQTVVALSPWFVLSLPTFPGSYIDPHALLATLLLGTITRLIAR